MEETNYTKERRKENKRMEYGGNEGEGGGMRREGGRRDRLRQEMGEVKVRVIC